MTSNKIPVSEFIAEGNLSEVSLGLDINNSTEEKKVRIFERKQN